MASTVASGARIAGSGWAARCSFAVAAGGPYYVLIENTSDSGLQMMKSTNGTSWTEMDAANSPTNSAATQPYSLSTNIVSNKTAVLYYTGTTTARAKYFDISSDTWVSGDIGSANIDTIVNNTHTALINQRSDGDVVVFYRSNSTTGGLVKRYEGVSWSSATTVNGTNATNPHDLIIDSNDRAWLTFADTASADASYNAFDSANTMGTTQDFDATAAATNFAAAQAVLFNDGTNVILGSAQRDSTNEIDGYFGIVTNAQTLGSVSTVSGISDGTTINTTSLGMCVAGGKVHVAWCTANDVKRDSSTSLTTLTFGTDVTVVTGTTDADTRPQCITDGTAWGVLYMDNGDVLVEWIVAPAAPTTARSFAVWVT